MARFALLFVGGTVPDDKRPQNQEDWMVWMAKLAGAKALVSGAAFGESRVVNQTDGVKAYDWAKGSKVSGFCVVEAADIDAAIAFARDCPQTFPEYGSGSVEVRSMPAA
ncbi:MAG TPA: hypothetical protein VHT70_03935 [Candidatus Saccharimonadales bacterium]|jgi:hypothetical protein|nr:hypothetical protein [Candidatus Saccharimonadales bacterium]